MTLKDYTDFVIALDRDLGIFGSPKAGQIRATAIFSAQDALNLVLRTMMGDSVWEKFAILFFNKTGRSDFKYKTILAAHVYENQTIFWSTLAEFCEPLIERTAEKPEGGQDAA